MNKATPIKTPMRRRSLPLAVDDDTVKPIDDPTNVDGGADVTGMIAGGVVVISVDRLTSSVGRLKVSCLNMMSTQYVVVVT